MSKTITAHLAEELAVPAKQVTAAITLLDEGATVPFIARYRKEVTGGLDDSQLRTLEERLHYLRDMEDRREAILDSIRVQEKLTPQLERSIRDADTKSRLEDLYLPYKPKRRTKAQIAIEAGLMAEFEKVGSMPDLADDADEEEKDQAQPSDHNIYFMRLVDEF